MGSMGIWCMKNGDSYPLVNSHIAMERSTMLLMGKSTILMGHFPLLFVCLPEGNPIFDAYPAW